VNIFGIGTQEVLIIAVVALIVFGPQRLPEVAGQAARWIRDFRKMTAELTGELERNAGVREFKDAIESEIQGVKSQVNQATSAVNKEISGVKSTAKAATTTSTPASTAIKGNAARVTSKPSTSTATKSAATSSTKSATPTVAAKPKPTKLEPEINISLMEEVQPKRRKAASNGAVPVEIAPAAPVAAVVPEDALARARERRLSAGYNRRLSS
jgi:sec-independent protein translocase protein TatB